MKKNVLLSILVSFFILPTIAQTSGIYESYAILSLNGGANTYYDLQATTGNPDFNGASLGMFRQGSTQLVLNGGQNKTYKSGTHNILNGSFYYRVYPSGGTGGSFSGLGMSWLCEYPTAGCGNNPGDQVWEIANGNVNILTGLSPGTYTIEVYTSAGWKAGFNHGTHYSSNGGANYKATFIVYSDFITTWKTDNPGSSANTSITIPTAGTGYNYDVDWNNDGIYDELGVTGNVTHDFGTAGTYTIRIRGAFPRICFNNSGDKLKLLNISQWGSIAWTSMEWAFSGCSNLDITTSDVPDLSAVTDMNLMFYSCSSLNGPSNIGTWNTSNVTNMSSMFQAASIFNQPIGNWNVSSVIDMSSMFANTNNFNQPIGNWNTSNVSSMNQMFYLAGGFDQNIGKWNLGASVDMGFMFFFSGLSCANYSATLVGWSRNPQTPAGRYFGAAGRQYNYTGLAARNYLVTTKGWNISDGGNAASSILGAVTGGAQVCQNADVSVGKLYTNGCNSLLMITPGGASPVSGSINACVKVDGTVQLYNGQPYLQRHFDITPSVNPSTSTARITLYVLQSEFDAFNLARGIFPSLPTGAADASGIANLRITQYGGSGTNPGNYTGPNKFINPDDADITWNGYHWEISFNVTGFSGFYIHTTLGAGALPVTLLSFSGYKDGSRNQLRWTTASEINNKGFEVQRSSDGISYSSIGFINSMATGGNSNERLSYTFTDNNPAGSKQYYRLRQEDLDGRSKMSHIVVIRNEKATDVMIDGLFPNPAHDLVNVLVYVPARTKLTLLITDMSGRTLSRQLVNAETGSNTVQLNVGHLASGTYLVQLVDENGCRPAPAKLVKQ